MLAGLIKWSHGRPLFPKDGEKLPGTTSFIQWPPVYTFLMLRLHSGNRSFSSPIPQAVPEIIRIDFTILQTGEVDFKKNQKFLFFVYFRLPWVTCTLLVKYLYYWLRPLIIHRYHHNYHQMISIRKLNFKISLVRARSEWGSRNCTTHPVIFPSHSDHLQQI